MLRVELRDLARVGSLHVEQELAEDDPLWEDVGLELGGPTRIVLDLTLSPTDQLLAMGSVSAPLVHECRRCLQRVERVLALDVALVWSPPDELSEDDRDAGEIRTLEAAAGEVDIGEALREELILAAPRYVLCAETCKGMCARCGADLNEGECECGPEEPDPRWRGLSSLGER